MNGTIRFDGRYMIENLHSGRIFLLHSLFCGAAVFLGTLFCYRATAEIQSKFMQLMLQRFDLGTADAFSLADLCRGAFRISLADVSIVLVFAFLSSSYISRFGCAFLLFVRGFLIGIHAECAVLYLWQGARQMHALLLAGCTAACLFLLAFLYCRLATDAVVHTSMPPLSDPLLRAKAIRSRFFAFCTAIGAVLILNLLLSLLLI
ncbi:MAG: hypothetical protein IJU41_08855 [Clostridia bacterium]|nr:hypothetical protein [Clostridia bacterium]